VRSATFIFFLAVHGIHLFLFLKLGRINIVQFLTDFIEVFELVQVALISDCLQMLVQVDLSSFVFGFDRCNGVVDSLRLHRASLNHCLTERVLSLGFQFNEPCIGLRQFDS
jgi:hypothetical protein